jgi:hypothetical protein
MLRRLEPVSDLQRAQRFDDYDLAANRSGALSDRQRWRFVEARLGEHLLGGLIVAFAAALLTNILIDRLAIAPGLDMIGIGLAIIFVAALVLAVIRISRALRSEVKSVSGSVEKHEAVPLAGVELEEVTIGHTKFFVPWALYDILDEDAIYKVYYLERSPRVGGNMMLSVEVVGTIPSEDMEE